MRVPITHTVRGLDGTPRADADVYVYYYGSAWTALPIFRAPVYAAATGGSALTQPLTPDSAGNVDGYVTQQGRYDILEDFGSVQAVHEWQALPGATETWTAPTLLNSWVNVGGSHAVAGYLLSGAGLTVLKGTVMSGTIGFPILALPAGYRPAERLAFSTISNNAIGRVDVLTDGTVIPITGGTSTFSLNGIMFEAEA